MPVVLRRDGEVFAKCLRNGKPHPRLKGLLASVNTPDAIMARRVEERSDAQRFRILSDLELDELPVPDWYVFGIIPSALLVSIR